LVSQKQKRYGLSPLCDPTVAAAASSSGSTVSGIGAEDPWIDW
jgi:hypothetical protein